MSATPARFRFDLDLGHRQERNSVLTESAMTALVANVRAEGWREGFAEGERTAAARAADALAAAATAIADRAAALNATLDDQRHRMVAEAVDLAATVGRKLATHLIASRPTAEIEALILECLASLDAVPHLVIHCAPDLADAVREIALARIATSGFNGRLVVLGDPEIGHGDARIEWVDGGLVRDRAQIETEIDTRIAAYLAARRSTNTGGTT